MAIAIHFEWNEAVRAATSCDILERTSVSLGRRRPQSFFLQVRVRRAQSLGISLDIVFSVIVCHDNFVAVVLDGVLLGLSFKL